MGYCAFQGANPGFRGPPIVEQVTLTSVRVTWAGLVTRKECADNFMVKFWLVGNTLEFQVSEYLPNTQLSVIVTDLLPNQDYGFQVFFSCILVTVCSLFGLQVMAREERGVWGVLYNKSDKTFFRTNSSNPTNTVASNTGDSVSRYQLVKLSPPPRPSVFTPQYWCEATYQGQTGQHGTSLTVVERVWRDGFNMFIQSFCSWLYKL